MASEVGIVNAALAKLGFRALLALTDDRTEARLAAATYEDIRDDVLRDAPWNFATSRAVLAADATPPAFGYQNAYSLPDAPTYCLRVLTVNDDSGVDRAPTLPWKVEGRQILTDMGGPIYVKFIYRVTNCDTMDSLFRDSLATRLAMEWAEKLTRTTTVKQDLAIEYDRKIRSCRSIDGQEGTVEDSGNGSWIDVRW